MNDRFIINTTDKEKVRTQVAAALTRQTLSDEELSMLLFTLNQQAVGNNQVELPDSFSELQVLGARPLNNSYNINVENALLLSAALVLDAFATMGVSMTMLTASGRNLRVIASASAESGALCNLITLEQWCHSGYPKSAHDVQKETANRKCCHPELPCSKQHDGNCTITEYEVTQNLTTMVNQAILKLDDRERVVKLY